MLFVDTSHHTVLEYTQVQELMVPYSTFHVATMLLRRHFAV